MMWILWLVLGAGLLAVELLVLDAQRYLVCMGISALLVGVATLIDGPFASEGLQWFTFAQLSVMLVWLFRKPLYARALGRFGAVAKVPVEGARVMLTETVSLEGRTRVKFRGTTWRACNIDSIALPAGPATIAHISDSTVFLVRAF